MKRFATLALFLPLLLSLVACGPGPEPAQLEGEETASKTAISYLRATEAGDFDYARSFLYSDADYVLAEPQRCQELLFAEKSTSMASIGLSRQIYDNEWHIAVDLKIGYGEKMKLLRFSLYPGTPPLLRSVTALKPE